MFTFSLSEKREESFGGPDHAIDVDVTDHEVLPHSGHLHVPYTVMASVVDQAPQT
jgi:hypothetical protein